MLGPENYLTAMPALPPEFRVNYVKEEKLSPAKDRRLNVIRGQGQAPHSAAIASTGAAIENTLN
jgi:hypothetical protein